MTCDSAEGATDKLVLANIGIDALSQESINAYRAAFDDYGRDRLWSYLKDEEFLLRLGAIGRSPEAGEIHPARAGLLMFGKAWRITDEYPDHFLDCRLVRRGAGGKTARYPAAGLEWQCLRLLPQSPAHDCAQPSHTLRAGREHVPRKRHSPAQGTARGAR